MCDLYIWGAKWQTEVTNEQWAVIKEKAHEIEVATGLKVRISNFFIPVTAQKQYLEDQFEEQGH